MIRWATIILSVAGLCVGVWAVVLGNEKPPQVPLARPPSVNPFAMGVASLGIVEPAGKNVSVVAPEAALVMEVYADVNDRVEGGTPLFKLDGRRLEADLILAPARQVAGARPRSPDGTPCPALRIFPSCRPPSKGRLSCKTAMNNCD